MSAQPAAYPPPAQWHAAWPAHQQGQQVDYSGYANYYAYPPQQQPAQAYYIVTEQPAAAPQAPDATADSSVTATPLTATAPAAPEAPAAPPPPPGTETASEAQPPLPNTAPPAPAPPPPSSAAPPVPPSIAATTADSSQIPGLGEQQPTDPQAVPNQQSYDYYNQYYQQYGQYPYQYQGYYNYSGYNYDASAYQQGQGYPPSYQTPGPPSYQAPGTAYPSNTQYSQQPQAIPAASAAGAATTTDATQQAYTYSYTNTPYSYPAYSQDGSSAPPAEHSAALSYYAPQQHAQHYPTQPQQPPSTYPPTSASSQAMPWQYNQPAAEPAPQSAQQQEQLQPQQQQTSHQQTPATTYIKPNNSIVKPQVPQHHNTVTNIAPPTTVAVQDPKPAYMSVPSSHAKAQADNTNTGATAPGSAQKAQAPNTAGKWPPSLHSFVERAFQQCRTDSQRQAMQVKLVTIIKEGTDKGELWTRNWDETRIPSLDDGKAKEDSPSWRGAKSDADASARWNSYTNKYSNVGSAKGSEKTPKGGKSWEQGHKNNKQGGYGKGKKGKQQHHDHEGGGKRWRKDDPDDEEYNPPVGSDHFKRQCRTARFGDGTAAPLVQVSNGPKAQLPPSRSAGSRGVVDWADSEEEEWVEGEAVKGTCTSLEKSYFRLTGVPNPSSIRPPPVLQQALDRLLQMLATHQVNYFYAQDQFKAMRQDLTVQRVRNELAVAVYEAHGRAAAEYGEMGDFNQCQTQLTILYSEGLPGARAEFTAYRLLYNTAHGVRTKQQLLNAMKAIPAEMYSDSVVAHALKVRQAVFMADAPAFFKLYQTAPLLLRAFMDLLARKVRFCALTSLVRSYRPTVPIPFVARTLGFVLPASSSNAALKVGALQGGRTVINGAIAPGCSSDVFAGAAAPADSLEDGCEACLQWLEACKAEIQLEKGAAAEAALVDCKLSSNSIELPPEQNKVAHGDANLAITDFLARTLA